MTRLCKTLAGLAVAGMLLANTVHAQDLEPRRWNHLPNGLNAVGLGYARVKSDIFFSPVLGITDGKSEVNSWVLQYQRAFDLFGKSARADILLPYVSGTWSGFRDGMFTTVSRRDSGDPWLRLSVNLVGAPALGGEAYRNYRQEHQDNTVVGVSLAVSVPVGAYNRDQFINVGSNRWVLRPQLGLEHTRGPWTLELTGSVYLFEDNDEFLGDIRLSQDTVWAVQSHLTRVFPRGYWLTLGTAYGIGGDIQLDRMPTAYKVDNWIAGASFGFPINNQQSVKATWTSGRTQNAAGRNFDSIVLSWSFKWLR